MTVSKNAADVIKPSRPRRKDAAEGAAEEARCSSANCPNCSAMSLKRAQLKVFEDFLRCVAPLQLTPAQFSVLLLLDKNPGRNQTEIANTLGILRPNFVAMLDDLESRDLCARMRSDQRPPLAHPGADRQGPGRAGARKKARRHQARGAAERTARPCQPRPRCWRCWPGSRRSFEPGSSCGRRIARRAPDDGSRSNPCAACEAWIASSLRASQ